MCVRHLTNTRNQSRRLKFSEAVEPLGETAYSITHLHLHTHTHTYTYLHTPTQVDDGPTKRDDSLASREFQRQRFERANDVGLRITKDHGDDPVVV